MKERKQTDRTMDERIGDQVRQWPALDIPDFMAGMPDDEQKAVITVCYDEYARLLKKRGPNALESVERQLASAIERVDTDYYAQAEREKTLMATYAALRLTSDEYPGSGDLPAKIRRQAARIKVCAEERHSVARTAQFLRFRRDVLRVVSWRFLVFGEVKDLAGRADHMRDTFKEIINKIRQLLSDKSNEYESVEKLYKAVDKKRGADPNGRATYSYIRKHFKDRADREKPSSIKEWREYLECDM